MLYPPQYSVSVCVFCVFCSHTSCVYRGKGLPCFFSLFAEGMSTEHCVPVSDLWNAEIH